MARAENVLALLIFLDENTYFVFYFSYHSCYLIFLLATILLGISFRLCQPMLLFPGKQLQYRSYQQMTVR